MEVSGLLGLLSVGNRRGGSWAVQWAITMSADKICPLENVRNEPRGCTAPFAWLGQARPPQFDLHPKTVLFIMRYP